MTTHQQTRGGPQSVIPYLVVPEPRAYLDFLQGVFGARLTLRTTGTAGGLHTELGIGDSTLMMGGGEGLAAYPAARHLYVAEADAVYRRAIEAGAASLYPPTDQFYGDREAGVKDPGGNVWYIATHAATGERPPGYRAVTLMLHPADAGALLDFLTRVFAAELPEVNRSPEGRVVHAAARISDSLLEVGEARGNIPPLPSMVMLHVNDADAVCRRALAAGAEAVEEPAGQPRGGRRAGFRDPFGHTWYVTAPLSKSRTRR